MVLFTRLGPAGHQSARGPWLQVFFFTVLPREAALAGLRPALLARPAHDPGIIFCAETIRIDLSGHATTHRAFAGRRGAAAAPLPPRPGRARARDDHFANGCAVAGWGAGGGGPPKMTKN